MKRRTIRDISILKGKQKIVCLTAYDYSFARLLDPHCEILLVGDSAAMLMHGHESTTAASLDMMISHAQAVMKGSKQALVIVDMPFGFVHGSLDKSFANCAKVISKTGCQAVKIEGGLELAETCAYVVARGVPVMGHIGLLPQHHNVMGYRFQGRNQNEADKLLGDAKALEEAGVFALLLEGVEADLAAEITKQSSVPTIGIGSGVACDGQILVMHDMLGLNRDHVPKFAKKFANIGDIVAQTAEEYAKSVRYENFPAKEHEFKI